MTVEHIMSEIDKTMDRARIDSYRAGRLLETNMLGAMVIDMAVEAECALAAAESLVAELRLLARLCREYCARVSCTDARAAASTTDIGR